MTQDLNRFNAHPLACPASDQHIDDTNPQSEPSCDQRTDDWATWLSLSSSPDARPCPDPLHRLRVSAGIVTQLDKWPTDIGTRLYVAYGTSGAVYVGQTRRLLLNRVRRHFGNQHTPQQQLKAGSWEFVVTALFDNLTAADLDHYERAAAEWLLPHRHRQGRRYPRAP